MVSSESLTILVHEWVTGSRDAGDGVGVSSTMAVEGAAMRRTIAAEFAAVSHPRVHVLMTLDTRWLDEPGPWMTVRPGDQNTFTSLIEGGKAPDYTVLIAPETNGVLAGLARRLEEEGLQSLGSSALSIALTGDKLRLSRWLESHDLPTPASQVVYPSEGLPGSAVYPAVLKPVDGAGALDTYWIRDQDDLPDAALKMPTALLQPYHRGIPMSASFLVEDDGQAWLLATGCQDIAIEHGRFMYRGGALPVPCPGAEDLLRRAVGSIPGLRGFVGVDFVWDPDRESATLLEINPRPTTSIVGLCRLFPPGRLARAWLAACGVAGFPREDLAGLPEFPGRHTPLAFDADGRVRLCQPR